MHGKAGRRGTVSDWMEMERARGISITSAALQFDYADHVVNLVDTPGHADFSEDTYRVLSAVDSAVMLVDAAKGLEPQTLKLFQVCAQRGIPVITVINKWDRPGLDPLQLMDEIQQKIRLRPTPLTWPVGVAGEFRGVLDRRTGDLIHYTRTAGGATRAPEERVSAADAEAIAGEAWVHAVEEHDLLTMDDADHDQATFLAGETTPVLFASALLNFGVAQLLTLLVELAPPPGPTPAVDGPAREVADDFSAFVFKVQSGMDAAHRDRLAYARVCSGVFERGMVVNHGETGKPFATKYAQAVFGRERSSVETAFPGDIVGLVNANALRVGDTIYAGEPVRVPADRQLRPRALRLGPRRGHRALQAVPPRDRADGPGGRRPGAPLGPARRPEPGARGRGADAVRGGQRPHAERVRGRDQAGPPRLLRGPPDRRRRGRGR